MPDYAVSDNADQHRFELETPSGTAVLAYERRGDRLDLLHTEVPPEQEGRGIASALVRHALEAARSEHLTVIPSCQYAASYIRSHPEYQELVARE